MLVWTAPNGSPGELVELYAVQGPQLALTVSIPNPAEDTPQSAIGVNGSAPVLLELQPTPHDAGLYTLQLAGLRRVSGSAGAYAATISYSSPLSGPVQRVVGADGLTGPNNQPYLSPSFVFFSTGLTPIVLQIDFFGAAGPLALDFYAAARRG